VGAHAGRRGRRRSIAIAAYLRARAQVLRQEQRNARAAKGEGAAAAAPRRVDGPPTASRSAQGPATATRGTRSAGPVTRSGAPAPRAGAQGRASGPRLTRNVMYLGAAAAGLSFVAVMLWVMAAPKSTEQARQAITAAVKRPDAARSAPAVRAGETAPAVAPAATDPAAGPSLAEKVQAMKQARNWNVLVLYAAEWTRKEPANAAAWRELSFGYANLRQLDDAFDAATRAVSLAPADGDAWRGLGRVNLALERWPDAGSAFNKALAVRADDHDALCGAVTVARREGRLKDADALSQRMGADASCQGYGESESVSVSVRSAAAKR
jgi:tetratricopeptide (TPR) repeat protein